MRSRAALVMLACAAAPSEAYVLSARPRAHSRALHQPAVPAAAAQPMRAPAHVNMAEKPVNVGVVGVTGAVGKEIIEVLATRKFPLGELKLFASARSAGKDMDTPFGSRQITEFSLEEAKKCDVVFLAVSGDFALEWAPKIADEGVLVIDNSSAFRRPPSPSSPSSPRGADRRRRGAGTTTTCPW